MPRKVAVLVGSLRSGSLSKAVAYAFSEIAAPKLECQFVEISDLPFYNPDLDTDAPPDPWLRFRTVMAGMNAVLFVTPEYNRSVPAALKNALDVGSRPYGQSIWNGKPAGIISVSPGMLGGFGANHHLRQPLVFLNMPVMQQPEAYLSKIDEHLNDEGCADDGMKNRLQAFSDAFSDWIDIHAVSI